MRYLIYGAGAIGGTIGAMLSRIGRPVTLIARGEHLARIQEAGLRLIEPDGESTLRIPAVDRAAAADAEPGDVVILAVKAQHALAALDELRAAAGTGVRVVCTENGVDSERLALRMFQDVYGMYTDLPTDHLEPGVVTVRHAAPHGILDLGRAVGGIDAAAEEIAGDLRSAGFDSRTISDVGRWKYGKLVIALGNAVKAICGQGPEYAGIVAAARAEALACYAVAGISYVPDQDQAERRSAVPGHGGAQGAPGSGWQSLMRGTGSIETDYINGEIALLGRLHRVPTPVNTLIQDLATAMARRREPAESLPLHELAARVAEASRPRERAEHQPVRSPELPGSAAAIDSGGEAPRQS